VIFAFQINRLKELVFWVDRARETFGFGERRWTTDVISKELVELFSKRFAVRDGFDRLPELVERGDQRLGHEASAELSEVTFLRVGFCVGARAGFCRVCVCIVTMLCGHPHIVQQD
jgi:hypothetical protein